MTMIEDFCMLRALLLDDELVFDDASMTTESIQYWQTIEVADDLAVLAVRAVLLRC